MFKVPGHHLLVCIVPYGRISFIPVSLSTVLVNVCVSMGALKPFSFLVGYLIIVFLGTVLLIFHGYVFIT